MKNNLYKILYYLSSIVIVILLIYCSKMTFKNDITVFYSSLEILLTLSVLSFIVTNIFLFKNKKFKTNTKDLLLPIIYLVFVLIVIILMVIYNKDAIIPYLHYTYYYIFLLIPYILLNLYTILLSKKG